VWCGDYRWGWEWSYSSLGAWLLFLAPSAFNVLNFGLALFLYAVGIQYGKQFFIGVTSASGLKDNLVAFLR
jgi:putative transport protein